MVIETPISQSPVGSAAVKATKAVFNGPFYVLLLQKSYVWLVCTKISPLYLVRHNIWESLYRVLE